MHKLVGYHRPSSVAEAAELLVDKSRLAVAGGTTIRHDGAGPPVEVVDLQSLGLDDISVDGDRLRLGSTVRLQALVDDDEVPQVVRDAAQAEQPSALRTLATVGGTVGAADRESLLLAAFLVHEAVVHFADDRDSSLTNVLDSGLTAGELIVAVSLARTGRGAIARTGRTPADAPIVAAVARSSDDDVRLALCGVADVPIVVDPDAVDDLDPPGDFRGSSTYRRHLAAVLSRRVLEELS